MGQLGIDAKIFEVTKSFYVVEVKKSSGDTLEYEKFCNKELKPSLRTLFGRGTMGNSNNAHPHHSKLSFDNQKKKQKIVHYGVVPYDFQTCVCSFF